MRQAITSVRRLRRLEQQIGHPIARAMVRGGTDHRIDIWTADGLAVRLWSDGTLEPQPTDLGWPE